MPAIANDDELQILGTAHVADDDVAAELSQRAAVIARKVWFLRHAQQCRDPSRCPPAPCDWPRGQGADTAAERLWGRAAPA